MGARDNIIAAATALIAESGGDINAVTIRAVAERAQVGVGLINYHFQTKENLVEQCVQRFIADFIMSFKPSADPVLKGTAYLAEVVKNVADFLSANPALSQISILGDMKTPGAADNTMKTVAGLTISAKGLNMPEHEKKLLLFAVTSVLQAMFLRRTLSGALFGVDFNDKKSRDTFIELIVGRLVGEGELR